MATKQKFGSKQPLNLSGSRPETGRRVATFGGSRSKFSGSKVTLKAASSDVDWSEVNKAGKLRGGGGTF